MRSRRMNCPGVLLPRVYGLMSPTYFGRNGGRLHSEYLGAAMLLLATLGIGGRDRAPPGLPSAPSESFSC